MTRIDPAATYAAFLTDPTGDTMTQVGIVSGAAALDMLKRSTAPYRLRFTRI